jgi:restriction system protein
VTKDRAVYFAAANVTPRVPVKFEIPPHSLFAVLMRSPWWVSAGISAVIILASATLLPPLYQPAGYFGAAPWLFIAGVAGWKQLRRPGAARVEETLAAIQAMNWTAFSKLMEDAFRRDGAAVTPLADSAADFELRRNGRRSLVCCRRWKAAHTGVEPLRQLKAARREAEAAECIFVHAGELSDAARRFADENGILLLGGAALVALLPPARQLRAETRG